MLQDDFVPDGEGNCVREEEPCDTSFGRFDHSHAENAECMLDVTLEECQCFCKNDALCWGIDWK